MTINLNPHNGFVIKDGKAYKRVLCYRYFNRERYAEVEVKNEKERLTILRAKGYNRFGLRVQA